MAFQRKNRAPSGTSQFQPINQSQWSNDKLPDGPTWTNSSKSKKKLWTFVYPNGEKEIMEISVSKR